MHNSLRDTPVYQEMMRMTREEALETGHKEGQEQGRQEGLQQGLQRGLQEGQQQALRDSISEVVMERFPELVALAEKKSMAIKNPAILRHILVKLSTARSAQEMEAYLNQIPEDVV